MKIIWMSDDISHQPTGYANESRQICFGLRDAGHEVVYIGCHSMQFEVVQYEGIKVHRIQGTGNKPVIQQILASEKPDLFITFWDLRKLMHISYMDRFINCPWLMYYLLDDQPLPFEYFRMYRQPSLHIIPGSEFLYDLYEKQGIPTLDYIPLGTDMDVFTPLSDEERQQLRKENLGDDADKVVFGFVGKNMPRKNIALLMEAFCRLPDEIKNDSLLLLHTQPQPLERGPQGVFLHGHDLLNLKKFYFDHPNIRFTRPEGKIGFDMKYVYGLYDWQVSATYQEGWGKCLDPDSLISIPSGVKRLKDIEVGEKVLTRSGIFGSVLDKRSRIADDLLEITAGYGRKIRCTSDHKLLVNQEWKEAKDIVEGDWLSTPSLSYSNDPIAYKIDILNFVDKSKYEYDDEHVWCKMGYSPDASGLSIKDVQDRFGVGKQVAEHALGVLKGTWRSRGKARKAPYCDIVDVLRSEGIVTNNKRVKINRFVRVNDLFQRFIGWFLAEGSIDNCKFELGFHASEKRIAKQLGFDIRTMFGANIRVEDRPESNSCRLVCYSKVLTEFLSNTCGDSSHAKHVPEFMMDMEVNLLPLVIAYAYGDGHFNQKLCEMVTKSRNLAWQVRTILSGHGLMDSSIIVADNGSTYRLRIMGANYLRFLQIVAERKSETVQKDSWMMHGLFDPVFQEGRYLVKGKWIEFSKSRVDKLYREGSWHQSVQMTKAVSIVPVDGAHEVIDISVEGLSFVANGLVVHNCTTEGMACEVPMIITGVSTADEICGDDWDWIVRPGATSIFPGVSINASYPSVQDFSDMMLKAYELCRNDLEKYQSWRRYSRDRIIDAQLDTPSVVKKWIEVIDSVKDKAGWENSYMFEEVVI